MTIDIASTFDKRMQIVLFIKNVHSEEEGQNRKRLRIKVSIVALQVQIITDRADVGLGIKLSSKKFVNLYICLFVDF